MQQRYHTVADDRDTYSPEVMQTNLNTFGALAIYLDQTPALELDLTATCDDLEEALNAETVDAAGGDEEAYLEALDDLRSAAEGRNEAIREINDSYRETVSAGAPAQELEAIRAKGRELNADTLEAFRFVQDHFIGIASTSTIQVKHQAYQDNAELIAAVIDALEQGVLSREEGDGALDLAWMLNGSTEYGYYHFSEETNAASRAALLEESNPGNLFWGTGKGSVLAETYPATVSLLEKAETGDADFQEEIAVYREELEKQQALLAGQVAQETASMAELARLLR